MKNKTLILSLLAVLIIILSGIGIGYFVYNNTLKKIERNQNNELIKLLDEYVQSIEGACVGDNVYKKLFGENFIKISELDSDLQLDIISNYFEKNYALKNIEYYEHRWDGGFYLDSKNISCVIDENRADAPAYESDCYSTATEYLYKFSDLEKLFNKVYGPNSKYYSNIISTQGFPTMNKLEDTDEYFNIVYRGGCGPDSFLDLNYSHYEKTKNKIELYYYFGYGLYEGKYYTGTMNNLILLEEDIEYSNLENMSNKYKNKLTKFKITFLIDDNNYYFDSIKKVD